MTADPERALRERFQALRRGAAARVPAFGETLAGFAWRRERAARRRHRVTALVAATAVLVLLVVVRPHRQPAVVVDLGAARWEAPTDFLLRTPGAELLSTIPTFTATGRLLP